jgi:hypothetical protein
MTFFPAGNLLLSATVPGQFLKLKAFNKIDFFSGGGQPINYLMHGPRLYDMTVEGTDFSSV